MLADSINLIDSSTGSNTTISLVRTAQGDLPNNTTLRKSGDPANLFQVNLTWSQAPKGQRIVTARYVTTRSKTATGLSEFARMATTMTFPYPTSVLSINELYGLISAHTSFLKPAGAAMTATDQVVRFTIGGEI